MTDDDEGLGLQAPRGTRDLVGAEKILKDDILKTIEGTMQEFGFTPVETPALELQALFEAKFGGGAEILAETYALTDRGGRKLVLRPEHTPSLARVVAHRRDLPYPFKCYNIGPIWRDGPIKLGRFREFWQCDADIVGPGTGMADAEIIVMTLSVFKKLGIDVVAEVNNRKILNGLMVEANVPLALRDETLRSLDKIRKIGGSGVEKELEGKGLPGKVIERLNCLLETDVEAGSVGSLADSIDNNLVQEGVRELEVIFGLVESANCGNMVDLNISLARGLAYYTGPIFEFFVKASEMSSSIAGGGRWDNMIGVIRGDGTETPAVGVSFGLDAVITAINLDVQKKGRSTITDVLVIPINTQTESFSIASQLRQAGIRTEVDLMGRNITKNLDYANSQKIPMVVIVGPREIEEGKLTLRDMESGEQRRLPIADSIEVLKPRLDSR